MQLCRIDRLLSIHRKDDVAGLQNRGSRRTGNGLRDSERARELDAQLVQRGRRRILLGLGHFGGALLIGVLHGHVRRVELVHRDHGLARIEPGGSDLRPTRRLGRVAGNVDRQHVERATRRVGCLRRDRDHRNGLAADVGRADRVVHGTWHFNRVRRRRQPERDDSDHRQEHECPANATTATSIPGARSPRVGENCHRYPSLI